GDIVELVCPNGPIWLGLRHIFSESAGKLHVVVRIGVGHGRDQPQVRTAEPEHVLLLLALGLRHYDDRFETHGIADEGETDAGIAGSAFHDRAARAERPTFQRVADNEQGGAVLYRAAGIQELGLAQDRATGFFRRAAKLDDGRVADGFY